MAQRLEQWTHNPLVVGSNPTGPNSQHLEDTAVTKTDKAGTKPENQNLVSGLFPALENDPDLRLIVKCWPELSVEMRQAMVKLVR